MDMFKLKSYLKTTRVVLIYCLIGSVIGIVASSYSRSMLSLSMNVMMGLIYILIGVVSAESIVSSMLKKRRRVKKSTKSEEKRAVMFGESVKRRYTYVNFVEGKQMDDGEGIGTLGRYVDLILARIKSYPRAISLAGLTELLVQFAGKRNAVKLLKRDVDEESLEKSYESFMKALDREMVEDFKYEVENVIMMESDPTAVIMGTIELVAREFGADKIDVVYAVLSKYAESL